MTRGIFNWTAGDVMRFLKEHHFMVSHTRGSHWYYVGHYGKQLRQVCVPVHANRSIKPRTMKGIIAQSGIPQKIWLDW